MQKVFRQVYYPLKERCEESLLLSLSAAASDAGAETMLCPYSRYNSEKGVSNELADFTSSSIHFLRYRRSKTLQADSCFEKEHSHDRNMFLVIKLFYMVIVPSKFRLFKKPSESTA